MLTAMFTGLARALWRGTSALPSPASFVPAGAGASPKAMPDLAVIVPALIEPDPLSIAAPLVAEFEGFGDALGVRQGRVRSVGHPYLCPAKVWTIGFGTTRWPDGRAVGPGDAPITRERGVELLEDDLRTALAAVRRLVKVPIDAWQTAALVSFVHNLGAGNLQGSTLLRALNADDRTKAGAEFPRWNRAGGQVLAGLVKRRTAERRLFERAGRAAG